MRVEIVMQRLLPFFLLFLLTMPAMGAMAATAATPLKLMLLWTPQAQFAGYYLARDKGFYAQAGLDVSILHGGPQAQPEQALKSGKADVALLWLSAALRTQTPHQPLVNIGQIVHRSGLALVARKSAGIR